MSQTDNTGNLDNISSNTEIDNNLQSKSTGPLDEQQEESVPTHKPTFTEKISGKFEEFVGKFTKNHDKLEEEGQAKQIDHSIQSSEYDIHSDILPQDHTHMVQNDEFNKDDKPINTISEEDKSNSNITPYSSEPHHIGPTNPADISEPPSSFNPYVIDNQSNISNNQAENDQTAKYENIPLPPSHQTPAIPSGEQGDKGNSSLGYFVHGGLPNQSLTDNNQSDNDKNNNYYITQSQSQIIGLNQSELEPQSNYLGQNQDQIEPQPTTELGLGQGGVADRSLVEPPTGQEGIQREY
ncbi:uncharacterized protein L201_003272 [Kwoniella dendrophila CBS 6074]|uniref:Uncharacterized protein n=1 Tax=Kwoniella dendrophila CBS 6074 TaxID=1295534 RepID=A0AAX4JUX7_9TREE